MTGRKSGHLPHCGTFWTPEMWDLARTQDRSKVPRRQTPVALLGDADVSARLLAAAAGLLHPPKVQTVDEFEDAGDHDVKTGSTRSICEITNETSSRLKKYLVRDGHLVGLEKGLRSFKNFDPYFEVHPPPTPAVRKRRVHTPPTLEIKKPRVLILLLMSIPSEFIDAIALPLLTVIDNDDIFATIKTIEHLVAAMVRENESLLEQSLIFNLIGGVRKTGPLALILSRFCLNLQRALRAFRPKKSPKQTKTTSKLQAQDEYYALPQWDNVEDIYRDTPLRQDDWKDREEDYEVWKARTDHIHKAFTIIPRGNETCVVRSYVPTESWLHANVPRFMDACEVALQWPEDKGIIQLGKSVSDLSDRLEETANSPSNDSSGSERSIRTTSSVSPASSFWNADTDTDTNERVTEKDIDNPIFHAYREAGELWCDRSITFVTIGPTINTFNNQPTDFVSQQFQLMHKDLEERGYLRYVWVSSKDLEQDFAHHAREICSP
ncbi:hypothetical protein GGR51DRAFT_532382 [Nemania sp. FL0031]|nr:hypothetical protein GGR51DRAFT_532382 [Nemania sp. FL0031]